MSNKQNRINNIEVSGGITKLLNRKVCQLLANHDQLGHWPNNTIPQPIQDAADQLGLAPQDPKFREQINKLAIHALNKLHHTSFHQRWEPAKNMWADGITKHMIAKYYGISEKALKTRIQKWRKITGSKISTYFPLKPQDIIPPTPRPQMSEYEQI